LEQRKKFVIVRGWFEVSDEYAEDTGKGDEGFFYLCGGYQGWCQSNYQ
jgi:hypothetical protein